MSLGHHPVLVWDPIRILTHILRHSVILGVEDVDSVEGGPDAMLVNVVIAVASNMGPLVNDKTLESGVKRLSFTNTDWSPSDLIAC